MPAPALPATLPDPQTPGPPPGTPEADPPPLEKGERSFDLCSATRFVLRELVKVMEYIL